MLNNAPIARRLDQLIARSLVQLWVVALVGLMLLIIQFVVGNRILTSYLLAVDETRQLVITMRWAQSDLRLYQDLRQPAVVTNLRSLHAEITEHRDGLVATLGSNPATAPDLAALSEALDRWWQQADEVQAAIPGTKPADITATNSAFEQITASADRLVAQAERERDFVQNIRQWVFIGGLLLDASIIAAATVTTRRQAREAGIAIVGPIEKLDNVVRRHAAGDFSARANTTLGPREIQAFSGELNSLLSDKQRHEAQQEELTRVHRMALRATTALRENSALGDAAEGVAEIISVGMQCDASVICYRSLQGTEVRHVWVHPASALSRIADTSVAAFLPCGAGDVATTGEETTHLVLTHPGTGRPVSVVQCPIQLGSDCFGTISAIVDHSSRQWSEQEVAMLEQISAAFARTLFERIAHHSQREQVHRLEELDRQKDALVSTVSHELRTPLTSISGYTEMLLEGDMGALSPRQQTLVTVIERNTVRLQGLIEDLLILNGIESSGLKAASLECDLVGIARTVCSLHASQAVKKGISLTVNGEPSLTVLGDPVHLERALANLISNAIKFTEPDGTVEVNVRREQQKAIVAVTDSGIGIPPEDQGRLFEKFFRASNALEQSVPGTGLGLSIVEAILDGHGGRLTVDSAVNQGTTITMILPIPETWSGASSP